MKYSYKKTGWHMQISTSANTVIIEGNVKSLGHFQEIKNVIDDILSTSSNIIMHLKDSISLTSNVIGYLTKLVITKDVSLQLKVENETLYRLLDDLNLISVLNVQKI
jgi:hypothetical protein